MLAPWQEVEARIAAAMVEIFHRGKRVASHRRSLRPHRPSTVPEHMPSAHRRYHDWTHERIRHEAQTVGPDAAVLIDVILARGRTLSRASALASASCAWSSAMVPSASMLPALARWC